MAGTDPRKTEKDSPGPKGTPITIKKYANRRLYNTATSSYVTLEHLCAMVKEGTDFVVYDARSGQDITRSVLTQIIVEEESKGQNLLPIGFLRQLIALYGNSLETLVPPYLEQSMQVFARHQAQMQRTMQNTFDGLMPFNALEELGRQNMALMENAMKMFQPGGGTRAKTPAPETPAPETPDPEVVMLREQVRLLQEQLAALQAERDANG